MTINYLKVRDAVKRGGLSLRKVANVPGRTGLRAEAVLADELNADNNWVSAWVSVDSYMPPYGKFVLVRHGKFGRVHIARRVTRTEHAVSGRKKTVISMFATRNNVLLFNITLWADFPK